ncbi:MAG TPA: hypothetical protein EYN93_15870 [Planctomycetaceae bacterium]|nr:hypothetical protein [Planctomycetaceae bacterium]
MLPHKDNASDSLITIVGVPKTVTRKIDGAIFNKVVTIEPDRELQVLVGQEGTKGWEFAGNGEQCLIRIEQFPAGYLEVNETYSSEIPDKDEIFKDDNCGDFGYTNPVKLQDFGGFIAYDDETNSSELIQGET